MMRNVILIVMLAACGGGSSEVPTCQQAVTHYYAAGCKLVDPMTGNTFPEAQIITECRDFLASAPSSCQDDLADWRVCFGTVPNPSRNNADCDCSAEQEALLTCR